MSLSELNATPLLLFKFGPLQDKAEIARPRQTKSLIISASYGQTRVIMAAHTTLSGEYHLP